MVHSHQQVTSGVSLREVCLFLQKLRQTGKKTDTFIYTQKITAVIILQDHTYTNTKADEKGARALIRST